MFRILSKCILKICLKCIFYKYDLYKIYVFKIRFFSLFLFKFTFFKNKKNVYNVLKLCIFYKSIVNKKTYCFYTISILDFLLFFIGFEIYSRSFAILKKAWYFFTIYSACCNLLFTCALLIYAMFTSYSFRT